MLRDWRVSFLAVLSISLFVSAIASAQDDEEYDDEEAAGEGEEGEGDEEYDDEEAAGGGEGEGEGEGEEGEGEEGEGEEGEGEEPAAAPTHLTTERELRVRPGRHGQSGDE